MKGELSHLIKKRQISRTQKEHTLIGLKLIL